MRLFEQRRRQSAARIALFGYGGRIAPGISPRNASVVPAGRCDFRRRHLGRGNCLRPWYDAPGRSDLERLLRLPRVFRAPVPEEVEGVRTGSASAGVDAVPNEKAAARGLGLCVLAPDDRPSVPRN